MSAATGILSRLCAPAIFKPGHDAIHNPVSSLLVASSQRDFREDNYLLSQIVKEQPIDASCCNHEEAPFNRVRTLECCRLARRTSNFVAGVAGGANRDRTGDLLLAKQALSQLSYGPLPRSFLA